MEVAARVADLLAPALTAEGAELVEVTLGGGILRVTVDADGGLDLDVLGQLTRIVSGILDAEDPVPGRYTLEVSSPGLERPLHEPRHFVRAVGSDVTLHLYEAVGASHRVDGKLEAADDDGVVVDGARFGYAQIKKARTVFQWGPSPKPGARPGSRKRSAQR